MASLVLNGNTSGSITLSSPAVSGTTVLTLPTVTGGTLVTSDSSGNVGIGTSSPNTKLSFGTSVIGSANEPNIIRLYDTGTASTSYGFGISSATMNIASGGVIAMSVSGTERMRIDSSGNVLVGTTSVRGKFNNVAASSQGSGYNAFFQNTWSGDVSTAGLYIAKFDNNSTTSQQFVRFSINNDATGSGQINANGASAAAFGSFSDKRLKENITDLPSQLNNIMALRPVEFDYIASEGGGHQIGFIAQEVKEIYPDLIGEREDGMFTLTDMNKNDARLIKCIQEQQTIINDLKARIETLESK